MARRAAEVAAEVRLRRSLHRGPFLLVEGGLDSQSYRQFTNESCRVVVADGKANVVTAVRMLDDLSGVAGVVDDDFDSILGIAPDDDDIVVTDGRDIEDMLWRSPGLERLVAGLTVPDRLHRLEDAAGQPLRVIIETGARVVGAFRFLAARDALGLRFDGIDFGDFTSAPSLAVDVDQLVVEVGRKSQRHNLDRPGLANRIAEILTGGAFPDNLYCGHDLLEILSFALRRSIASANASDVTASRLGLMLSYAFDRADWHRSQLAQALNEWESRNSPYLIVSVT